MLLCLHLPRARCDKAGAIQSDDSDVYAPLGPAGTMLCTTAVWAEGRLRTCWGSLLKVKAIVLPCEISGSH